QWAAFTRKRIVGKTCHRTKGDEARAMIDNGEFIGAKAIPLFHYAERADLMRGGENQAEANQPACQALASLRLPQARLRKPPDRSRSHQFLRTSRAFPALWFRPAKLVFLPRVPTGARLRSPVLREMAPWHDEI